MTKLLLPLQIELYIFTYDVSLGVVRSIGIGNIIDHTIETHEQAFIMMSQGLYWRVDILKK